MATGAGLTSRSLKGFLLLASSTAGQAVVNIILLGVLARLLTPSDFGVVTAALVVTLLGDSLCRLGLGPALVQRPQIEARHIITASQTTLLLGLGLALALVLGRHALESAFRIQGLAPVLLPLALVFPLRSACVVAEALAQRNLRFGVIGSSQATSYFLGYGLCGVSAAYAGAGLWSMVIAQLAQALIRSVMLVMMVPHPRWGKIDRQSLTELLPFGLDVTAVELLSYIANQADKFIAGRWLGAEQLGVYGRAYQLTAAPALGFSLIVDKVLFPVLASVQTQPERLRRAYTSAQTAVGLITLPASALILILAPELIRLVLGPGWDSTIRPFQWLAVGTFLRTGYKLSGTLARSLGRTRAVVTYQAVYAVLVTSFCYLLMPLGINGIAIGVLIALVVEYVLLTRLSCELTGVSMMGALQAILPGLLLSTAAGAPSWMFAQWLRTQNMSPLVITVLVLVTAMSLITMLLWASRRYWQSSDLVVSLRNSRKKRPLLVDKV